MAITAPNRGGERTRQTQSEKKEEADLNRKEAGKAMSAIAVEFTRKKLYEEIWKLSVAGVARKYGIPYAKCLAQVKEAQIPVPPSGYWTKSILENRWNRRLCQVMGTRRLSCKKTIRSGQIRPVGKKPVRHPRQKRTPDRKYPWFFLLWSQPHKRLRRRKLDKGAIHHWRRFKDGDRPFMCMIGKRCTGKFGRVP